jgi:hypothetical protein
MKCKEGETWDRKEKLCRKKISPGRKKGTFPQETRPKLSDYTFTRSEKLEKSPKKPSIKKSPEKLIKPIKAKKEKCYMFNDIKFCEPARVKYYEEQKHLLCGIHAINNLFQNQTKIPKPPIMTKEMMDRSCFYVAKYILGHKNTEQLCTLFGFYNSKVLVYAIESEYEKLDVYYTDSTTYKVDIESLLNNDKFIGCIYLYKAPGMENHWVTMLPHKNKYLIIDSEKFQTKIPLANLQDKRNAQQQFFNGNAEVLDTPKEVEMYFREFIGMIVVKTA